MPLLNQLSLKANTEYANNGIEIIFETLQVLSSVRVETANFVSANEPLWHVFVCCCTFSASPGGTSLEPSLVLNVEPWNQAQLWYFSEMEKEKYVLHTWTPQVMGT